MQKLNQAVITISEIAEKNMGARKNC